MALLVYILEDFIQIIFMKSLHQMVSLVKSLIKLFLVLILIILFKLIFKNFFILIIINYYKLIIKKFNRIQFKRKTQS